MSDSIVSVAVAVGDGQMWLAKIDRSLPLEAIIAEQCAAHGYALLGESDKYALQITRPSPKAENPYLSNRYVTPELLPHVLDGTELRLVFSATTTAHLLLEVVAEGPGPRRKSAFLKLAGACEDPEFARCFVEIDGPSIIMDRLRTAGSGETTAALACLRLSMQHGYLEKLSLQGLDKVVVEIVNSGESGALREALLTGCLVLAGEAEDHATRLREALTTSEILTLMKQRPSEVQLAVLGMVNAILLSSDFERRKTDLKILSSSRYRQLIFRHVLDLGQKRVDHDTAHQLHVLQTLLLNEILGKSLSAFMKDLEDFKPSGLSCRESMEPLLEDLAAAPASVSRRSSCATLDGVETDYMPATPGPSPRPPPTLRRIVSQLYDSRNAPVSCLTLNCLEYFSLRYRDNFALAKDEAEMVSDLSRVAQDVVEILCALLHIGTRHGQTSDRFSPIFYAARDMFFEELFCHAMWTLGRIGRELKAKGPADHSVALRVLQRQLEEALAARPTTLSALAKNLKEMTAVKIQDLWTAEQEENYENILQKHPAVQELKSMIKPNAERLVVLQRLNALKIGHKFSKQLETLKAQKAKNWWFAHLSEDERVIIYGEWDPEAQAFSSLHKRVSMASATGLATGKRCPHAKGRKYINHELFFSLLHDGGSLDFIALTKEVAGLWIEGLTILLGRPVESEAFKEDVKMVIDMEIRLKLLELGDENIPVPFDAPPVPASPDNYDFSDETEA